MPKKNKGLKFESKVSSSIGSGRLWFSPLDINYEDYCIECKLTDQKGYRVTKDLLEKIWSDSLSSNKMPRLIIGIKRNDNEVFILNCDINIEKK